MIQSFIHLVCMLLLPKALRRYITPDRPQIIPSTAHVTPAIQIHAKRQPAEADQAGSVDNVQGQALLFVQTRVTEKMYTNLLPTRPENTFVRNHPLDCNTLGLLHSWFSLSRCGAYHYEWQIIAGEPFCWGRVPLMSVTPV